MAGVGSQSGGQAAVCRTGEGGSEESSRRVGRAVEGDLSEGSVGLGERRPVRRRVRSRVNLFLRSFHWGWSLDEGRSEKLIWG